MRLADLVGRSGDSLAIHRIGSVCSDTADKDLIPLIRSWNVYTEHHWYTSYHSVQLPELLAFCRTFWQSVSEDPSHTELLHRKIVSSVSLTDDKLRFPPTSLSSATQLPPKRALAPFLCFAPTASTIICCGVRMQCLTVRNRCVTRTKL